MAEKAESIYRNQRHFLLRSCLRLALEVLERFWFLGGILGVEFRLMIVNL